MTDWHIIDQNDESTLPKPNRRVLVRLKESVCGVPFCFYAERRRPHVFINLFNEKTNDLRHARARINGEDESKIHLMPEEFFIDEVDAWREP